MPRKQAYDQYIQEAKELYAQSFEWQPFPHSMYNVSNRNIIEKAITYISRIPKTDQSIDDLKLLRDLYKAASFSNVKPEHLQASHFEQVHAYREKAVATQREIVAKTNDGMLILANDLRLSAIAHLGINKSEYLQIAQQEINEAIKIIQSQLQNKISDFENLLDYHVTARNIANKQNDFLAIYEHHQAALKCLEQIRLIDSKYSFEDVIADLEFNITQAFRKPDAALTLAKQLVTANQQINTLQIENTQYTVLLKKNNLLVNQQEPIRSPSPTLFGQPKIKDSQPKIEKKHWEVSTTPRVQLTNG